MKKIKTLLGGALILALGLTAAARATTLNGAGATFPYPIYSKWFYEYHKMTGIKINYQSIGSGGGIRQVIAGTVDFGGTDAPMSPVDMAKVGKGVLHIPTVIGAVVVAYNLPGAGGGLKLTPEVLVAIFMGEITRWDDPAIRTLNPGLNLPSTNITVAHRSDGSGTTSIFVDYLSKVSARWAAQVGKGTSVKWPAGVGGKGNEGVAGLVKQIPGTIGYMEFAYAKKNNLPWAKIRNKAGNYPDPSIETTASAAAGALKTMPSDFRVSITNAPGANAYPIAGFTWLLVYGKYDSKKGSALVEFVKWALDNGDKMASDLYYAPLPESLVEKIKVKLDAVKR
jgi:phosphate transport system substrate-binding protein